MAILQSFRVQAIESKKKSESLVKMSPSSVVPKASIAFSRSPQPTTDLVSKFGGQPVWLEVPQWPTSPATGAQMQFIGQIAIDRSIFPDASGQMAYIFMTEAEGVATFSADSGENAVIIQPGVAGVPVCTKSHGPTVSELAILDDLPLSGSREVEFTVQLSFGFDGSIIASDTPGLISQEGSKLGGFPYCLPDAARTAAMQDGSRLLLQLDSMDAPFILSFDGGIGYVFLSSDGTKAKFFWRNS